MYRNFKEWLLPASFVKVNHSCWIVTDVARVKTDISEYQPVMNRNMFLIKIWSLFWWNTSCCA